MVILKELPGSKYFYEPNVTQCMYFCVCISCRDLAGERLKLSREFFDERWSKHRIVTSLDWSTQVCVFLYIHILFIW